ncbi:uncharacterized protein LOC134251703 [Saccostrea cucullata]|uniref:uncharacterized protein LOC134251703 n=1 Tax=Saccostrea cuccullata TaxID=36930 RepID=UPI002ED022A6
MNKAIILIGTTCLLAIAIAQVSAYYGNTMMLGTGVGYPSTVGVGNAAARSNYYDNYYKQYERYNRAQAARTINKSVNGLQTSALLSLFSLFGLALIATNTTGTLAG